MLDANFGLLLYRNIPAMSLVVKKKRFSGFPTRSHTNRAVQPQKMARGLKFRIQEVEGLYYLCSENKGADQLRSYREAHLRLCFRICKKPVFSRCGSNVNPNKMSGLSNACWVIFFPVLFNILI